MIHIIVSGFLNPYGKGVLDINKEINKMLSEGFGLQGNLLLIKDNEFCQAMCKKDKENNAN